MIKQLSKAIKSTNSSNNNHWQQIKPKQQSERDI